MNTQENTQFDNHLSNTAANTRFEQISERLGSQQWEVRLEAFNALKSAYPKIAELEYTRPDCYDHIYNKLVHEARFDPTEGKNPRNYADRIIKHWEINEYRRHTISLDKFTSKTSPASLVEDSSMEKEVIADLDYPSFRTELKYTFNLSEFKLWAYEEKHIHGYKWEAIAHASNTSSGALRQSASVKDEEILAQRDLCLFTKLYFWNYAELRNFPLKDKISFTDHPDWFIEEGIEASLRQAAKDLAPLPFPALLPLTAGNGRRMGRLYLCSESTIKLEYLFDYLQLQEQTNNPTPIKYKTLWFHLFSDSRFTELPVLDKILQHTRKQNSSLAIYPLYTEKDIKKRLKPGQGCPHCPDWFPAWFLLETEFRSIIKRFFFLLIPEDPKISQVLEKFIQEVREFGLFLCNEDMITEYSKFPMIEWHIQKFLEYLCYVLENQEQIRENFHALIKKDNND